MEPMFTATSLPRVFRPVKVDQVRASTASSPVRPRPDQARASTASSGTRPTSTLHTRACQKAPSSAAARPPLQPRDEVGILYPFANMSDDDGSIQAMMWSKWNVAVEVDDNFTSFALFGQVKLQEAQAMCSWLHQPNQFLTAVAVTLVDKFAEHLGTSGALLRQLVDELVAAIYLRRGDDVHDMSQLDQWTMYSHECQRLKRTCLHLLDENTRKRTDSSVRHVGFERLERVIDGTTKTWKRKVTRLLFYNWVYFVARRRRIRTFMDRTFHFENRTTVKETFRAWRVEALRRAYYVRAIILRESANYQAMLSVTAESLSRKDIQLTDAAAKITDLQAQVDQLTSINSQLVARVQELEAMNRALRAGDDGDAYVPARAVYEPLDTIADTTSSHVDESPKVNRLLLESLFAMARMVESSVIQSSNDVLESLQRQMDGAELRELSDAIFRTTKKTNATTTSSSSHEHHTIHNLLTKPIDVILLHWMRLQLNKSTATNRPQDKILKNFTEDLADGQRFSLLLHQLHPVEFDATMVGEIDVDVRLEQIERFNRECHIEHSLDATLPPVVTAESIAGQKSTENFVFVAMLFGIHKAHFTPLNTDHARKVFLHIVTCWKKIRNLMLEIKRTQEDVGDNTLLLALVKELKSCESYHKQMQTELTTMACASNESATVLSQLAHKILCLTWRLLSEKTKGVHEDVVDERRAQTMQKFTLVQPGLIRDIILSGPENRRSTLSDTEVLTRVLGIQKVLQQWFKELCAIFRHYSCGALRGRSTTMSSGEWNKFIKDCAVVDKKLPLPVVEAVYYQVVNADKTAVQTTTAAKEMSPSMFISALVLLADKKFPTVMFEDRIRELIEKCIIPHACRSQPEVFRMLLSTSDVRGVYQRFKPTLQRTFKYYSSIKTDESSSKSSKSRSTIGIAEFIMLTKDCKLIGSYVTENTVKQIFVLVQRHYDDDDDEWGDMTANEELQVDYIEFEEALGALTEYVVSNPYIPFFKRLEQFIGDMVLPRARQKKPAKG
ncbi:Aste57867_8335 [Aphanomyces stellatus]|uniref:Aste57867_8335 protein n=1 Tax=Aphanomyces stellatus TaxID=120398 RepID=A0A485KK03_9STRA|nr:hypothetical protein As57867_008303 [Aphanomyces stellatus]VFT85222.1 Aste57867_8335 [Aphanomyces stellatus]